MSFIIETDIGHDPDDLFCLCHLLEAGKDISAIGIVPGSPEQVHLVTGLRELFGLSFLVGTSKADAKQEKLGIHDQIIKKFALKNYGADGSNREVFDRVLTIEPDAEVLVIGPAPGLRESCFRATGKLTFQGGFLPYSLHYPYRPQYQFLQKHSVPTFNFNGCLNAVAAVRAAPFSSRRFCGKNICHSVVMTSNEVSRLTPARTRAGEVYAEAVSLYFKKHKEKKLHDPVALVCHLHSEIATWFRGMPVQDGGKCKWTTKPDPNGDYILADIDYEAMWHHILNKD